MKKLSLNDLSIQSFVTSHKENQAKGGFGTIHPCSRAFTDCGAASCFLTCPLACADDSVSCFFCDSDICR